MATFSETAPNHSGNPAGNQRSGNQGHSPRHWLLFLLFLVAVAILFVFVGWIPRTKLTAQIDREAQERTQEHPKVEVTKVVRATAGADLTIPGTTLAYREAFVYARSSGYVSKRLVDIGDHVHSGQLLAIVDAPDLDQQVSQARSTLAQSEAAVVQLQSQQHLAQLTWDRYKVLVSKGVFSKQDGDNQEAGSKVADANVIAAQSNVQANRDNLQRMLVLQQYEKVTAPFDGVITQRNIDVGSLISATGTGLGNSPSGTPSSTQAGAQGSNSGPSGDLTSSVAPSTGGSQGGGMFGIASLDPLRILVSVPEAYAAFVHMGEQTKLNFQGLQPLTVTGKVARTSSSIDPNTRTLLVEVQARNPTGKLLPGMYVMVDFSQLKATPPLVIPGESIVVRGGKNLVAVVEDRHVHFVPVRIGRDYGDLVEITGGLEDGQLIAHGVSDEVQEGVEIDPQFQNKQAAPKK
ncbi:MAG TPA: efflux RND transporter periplasmic adaptor subunit [Bryobacteraceae bacterium]|jgi:multidrug efflux pump subunit AcrA (membrane-fusion protein)